MTTEVEQISTALAEYSRVEAGIAQLKERYGGVLFEVASTAGLESAKQARAAVREPRFEVERVRQSAKAPLLQLGRRLDAEAKRITAALLEIETPVDVQIKAEEQRRERERLARVQAELDRVTRIQLRIAEIRGAVQLVERYRPASAMIQAHIDDVAEITVDNTFAEFEQTAERAQADTLKRLNELKDEAVARETEAERVASERAELNRRRADDARREAEAKAEVDRQEELSRATARARLLAEESRLAALRAAQEAEAKLIADQRAEVERREAALVAAATPLPVVDAPAQALEQFTSSYITSPSIDAPPFETPTLDEMIDVLAGFYRVRSEVIEGWLAACVSEIGRLCP